MAETLRLRVLTPQREIVDETVDSVVAEGALGQFGVLPKHITFLSALEPGLLSFERGGSRETIAVKGGYAEVRDDEVTVLADEARRPEEVDQATAAAELERATRALEEHPFGDPGHEQARRDVRWAEVLRSLAR